MHAKLPSVSRFPSLACLSIFLLGQAMLLEQSCDLIRTPKVMVDLPILGFPHCSELDYTLQSAIDSLYSEVRSIAYFSRYSALSSP